MSDKRSLLAEPSAARPAASGRVAIENLNMKPARGLDKSMIRDLFTCRWIGERRHLIITGTSERLSLTINVRSPAPAKAGWPARWAIRPPARATACCICGCRGCSTIERTFIVSDKRSLLAVARLGSGVGRRIAPGGQGQRFDPGRLGDARPHRRASGRDLMEIIDDRHDRGSIILATQVPVDRWRATIGDPIPAFARTGSTPTPSSTASSTTPSVCP